MRFRYGAPDSRGRGLFGGLFGRLRGSGGRGRGVVAALGLGDGLDVVADGLDVDGKGEPAVLAVELEAGVDQAANELGRGNAMLVLDGAKGFTPLGVDAHADLIAELGHAGGNEAACGR